MEAGTPEGIINWIDVPSLDMTSLLMKEAVMNTADTFPAALATIPPVTGPMALPSICAENCRLNALLLISVFVARIRMELADGITPAKQKP